MPTYISLVNWTQKGIENVKDSAARLDKAKSAIKAAGGKLKAAYMTIGEYDLVVISEAPDDAAFARAMLQISSGGTVRTRSMKAFNEEEYRKIVSEL
ncbi:MAG TPA: GYD domain-containing protein [Bryobacterales bacterium]|nr:GYD domain-containing protein [Bryobacterales bacterium]